MQKIHVAANIRLTFSHTGEYLLQNIPPPTIFLTRASGPDVHSMKGGGGGGNVADDYSLIVKTLFHSRG